MISYPCSVTDILKTKGRLNVKMRNKKIGPRLATMLGSIIRCQATILACSLRLHLS